MFFLDLFKSLKILKSNASTFTRRRHSQWSRSAHLSLCMWEYKDTVKKIWDWSGDGCRTACRTRQQSEETLCSVEHWSCSLCFYPSQAHTPSLTSLSKNQRGPRRRVENRMKSRTVCSNDTGSLCCTREPKQRSHEPVHICFVLCMMFFLKIGWWHTFGACHDFVTIIMNLYIALFKEPQKALYKCSVCVCESVCEWVS